MRFAKRRLLMFFGFMILSLCLIGCASSRRDSVSSENSADNSTPVSSNNNAAVGSGNPELDAVNAEREKLEKDRAKLEKEKQNLKDEKAKNEKMKDAAPPESAATATVYVVDPPSNIRDSPNGKILCSVKKAQTPIKVFGSTEIYDNNGEWYYTNYCGKMGVIHSSQIVNPG